MYLGELVRAVRLLDQPHPAALPGRVELFGVAGQHNPRPTVLRRAHQRGQVLVGGRRGLVDHDDLTRMQLPMARGSHPIL